jgi:hypothetical protein
LHETPAASADSLGRRAAAAPRRRPQEAEAEGPWLLGDDPGVFSALVRLLLLDHWGTHGRALQLRMHWDRIRGSYRGLLSIERPLQTAPLVACERIVIAARNSRQHVNAHR